VASSIQRRALEYEVLTRRASTENPRALLKCLESEVVDDTVGVLMLVSAESVTCGVTVAHFGVLGFF